MSTKRILYVGMRNNGGPGKIGKQLLKICEINNFYFRWYHSSKHIEPIYELNSIFMSECLDEEWDLIFYNQWRDKFIFSHFNAKCSQVLFLMYEEIPLYYRDFLTTNNYLLSPNVSIMNYVGDKIKVIKWAESPVKNYDAHNKNEKKIIFYPARDGGEEDRKSIFDFSKSLEKIKIKSFIVRLVLSKKVRFFYETKAKNIFTDKRVIILDELTDDEYHDEITSCDGVLIPSKTSGIELALLDAFSNNKDVIISDTEPMNEYCNKDNAWMVDTQIIKKSKTLNGIIYPDIYKPNVDSLAKQITAYVLSKNTLSPTFEEMEQRYNNFKNSLNDYINSIV